MNQTATQVPTQTDIAEVAEGTDLIEWYYERGYSDGLPLVPQTSEKIAAVIEVLDSDPRRLISRVPPRWGSLTREVLAINMVMAGGRPGDAPGVEEGVLRLF